MKTYGMKTQTIYIPTPSIAIPLTTQDMMIINYLTEKVDVVVVDIVLRALESTWKIMMLMDPTRMFSSNNSAQNPP